MRLPFRKTYRHRCPDGSYKLVHRNLDDAFPLYVPGWKGVLGGDLSGIAGAPVKLRGEYATQIQGLLYSLDDLNQSLMMNFRAVYAAYQTDPCQNGKFLTRQVDRMVAEQQRLNDLRLKIRALVQLAESQPDRPAEIWDLFQEIVQRVGGRAVPAVTVREIEEARTDARAWATADKADSGA